MSDHCGDLRRVKSLAPPVPPPLLSTAQSSAEIQGADRPNSVAGPETSANFSISINASRSAALLKMRRRRRSRLPLQVSLVGAALFLAIAASLSFLSLGERLSGPHSNLAKANAVGPIQQAPQDLEKKVATDARQNRPPPVTAGIGAGNEPQSDVPSPALAGIDRPPTSDDLAKSPLASNQDATGVKPAAKAKKKAKRKVPTKNRAVVSSPPLATPTASFPDQVETFDRAIVELYRTEKLLARAEYPQLRGQAAAHFARKYDDEIRSGLAADYDAMQQWLNDHVEIREELYTAINADADDISAALRLFNELRKSFPSQLASYANLGIATAVVWDDARRGTYHYEGLARSVRSSLPTDMLDGIGNFRYLVAAEPMMQGRIQHVPWEFLVHVVNHSTPERERMWALQNYLGRRMMIGSCYSDVPYDYGVRKLGNSAAKLSGHDYTLPSLLKLGGTCAFQADFAARVAKSIGVPAARVAGPGENAEGHAWVMWVELKQATPAGLVFSLESHGRYRDEKYYVGTLRDPQTGRAMTDRDLELRLQTVGMDTIAKRQASLVMQIYPRLSELEQLDVDKRLALLSQVIDCSPGCEQAWLEIAQVVREVSGRKQYAKQVAAICDRLFVTFARMPDFTWKIFGDLSHYESDGKQRIALFERLLAMYESAGRPDLACEARLQVADMLVEQKQAALAVERLALTIKKFPSEGRYVPKMLDKIEQVCQGFPGAEQKLVQFYVQILPLIPQKTSDGMPSPFALKMFKRAADVFNRCHQPQLAQLAQAEHDKLKASRGLNN
jgi:hypothetical protein